MNKIVLIESPYAGDVKGNLAHLDRVMRLLIDRDFIPVAPHLMWPRVMDDSDPAEREQALVMCRDLRNQILKSGGLVAFAPRTEQPPRYLGGFFGAVLAGSFSPGMIRAWDELTSDNHNAHYHSAIGSVTLCGVYDTGGRS